MRGGAITHHSIEALEDVLEEQSQQLPRKLQALVTIVITVVWWLQRSVAGE
jgi:hypothetical protein